MQEEGADHVRGKHHELARWVLKLNWATPLLFLPASSYAMFLTETAYWCVIRLSAVATCVSYCHCWHVNAQKACHVVVMSLRHLER